MNIIFSIDGGLGKSIMATAVLKALRKQYKKAYIIVVSAYRDVFIGNPNADKVIGFDQLNGVYAKYIMNQDAKLFVADPYHTSDFLTEKKHLIQIWCESFGIEYNGEMPEFFFRKAEKEYFEPFYKIDKPIMVIHPHGGAQNQPLKYSWTRDIPSPIIQQVIDHYKRDYAILHIKRQDQITYPDTLQALDTIRSIGVLLEMSQKRLFIDSSSMHLATALNLPSTVAWVGTNPKVFGYEMHTNIVANEPNKEVNLEHPHYQKYLLFQDISTIPYESLNDVFEASKIINALK
jgi:ADP-heptose:LPS heptosyltransferase